MDNYTALRAQLAASEKLAKQLLDIFAKMNTCHGASDGQFCSGGSGGGGGSVPDALDAIKAKFPVSPSNPDQRVLMAGGKVAATFEVAERDGRLRLKTIQSEEAGSGIGTLVMRRITRVADEHGVTMELTASPYGGGNRISSEKLRSWYGTHGFKMEAGHDESLGYMIRPPKS